MTVNGQVFGPVEPSTGFNFNSSIASGSLLDRLLTVGAAAGAKALDSEDVFIELELARQHAAQGGLQQPLRTSSFAPVSPEPAVFRPTQATSLMPFGLPSWAPFAIAGLVAFAVLFPRK